MSPNAQRRQLPVGLRHPPPHPAGGRVLTSHEGVVIGVGEAGEVWGQVIHFDAPAHNLFEPGQGLQGLVADVVRAKAIQQEHQELPSGRGWQGQAKGEAQQEGAELPSHAARDLPEPAGWHSCPLAKPEDGESAALLSSRGWILTAGLPEPSSRSEFKDTAPLFKRNLSAHPLLESQETHAFGQAGSSNSPELTPGEKVQPYYFWANVLEI